MKDLDRIKQAIDLDQRAAGKLNEVIERELPPGTVVHYMHGDHRRTATVVEKAYGPDLIVTTATGKRVSLDAHRIIEIE